VAGAGEDGAAVNRHWSKLPFARSGDKSVALKLLIVSPSETGPSAEPNDRTFIGSSIFLCFFEHSQVNIYVGELVVRPLAAPTTEPHKKALP
jgi:hypothetical protein